ncbi:MAG TPA: alpha/beta hydrolase [Cytophagaceae bacterium]|jgi:pimeloyl-ACP methyl ester carboxylesterase|nr:alpha/beta hydrolase [Cytophagaceae bacterium]
MKKIGLLIYIILYILIMTSLAACTQEHKEIKRDHAEINYTVTGKGDTTLLFVHGSYIDQSYWKEQVTHFNPRYKVVTFDLPGHGKSGRNRKDWSVKGFAEDVSTLIDELDLKNVVLIGHSMGGDINLIAATAHPEHIAGFVGIDNFKNVAMSLPQTTVDSIMKKLISDFADTNEEFARKMLLTQNTSLGITEKIVKAYRCAYEPMSLAIMPEILHMAGTEKELLPKLSKKLYLINVDYSPTNEEPLKRYPGKGYELMHLEGTCHFPMIEKPVELNQLIAQALYKIGQK